VNVSAVVVAPSAVQTIRAECTSATDGLETGGILLGDLTHGVARVRHAGDPGPGAVRRRDFFLRDRGHAQKLADIAFDADGSIWIGEWHSHVEVPPVPSRRDLTTYARLLADDELGFDVVISLIVGDTTDGTVLTAWGCTPPQATELPILVADPDSAEGQQW
jgi:integrative and conjugative element protein (TIGR02256 family)